MDRHWLLFTLAERRGVVRVVDTRKEPSARAFMVGLAAIRYRGYAIEEIPDAIYPRNRHEPDDVLARVDTAALAAGALAPIDTRALEETIERATQDILGTEPLVMQPADDTIDTGRARPRPARACRAGGG